MPKIFLSLSPMFVPFECFAHAGLKKNHTKQEKRTSARKFLWDCGHSYMFGQIALEASKNFCKPSELELGALLNGSHSSTNYSCVDVKLQAWTYQQKNLIEYPLRSHSVHQIYHPTLVYPKGPLEKKFRRSATNLRFEKTFAHCFRTCCTQLAS